jgi:zinc protease
VALASRQLAAPAWPEAVWQRDRQRWLAAPGGRPRPDRARTPGRAFAPAVYGDHPYGREAHPNPERHLGGRHAAFYRRHVAACRAQVVLVGAIDRACRRPHRRALHGRAGTARLRTPAAVPEVAPLAQAVERRMPFEAAQAQVLIGQPGIARNDPDFFPLFVGNYILGGGGFVSRLTTEVREKRGLSYSVYSYFAPACTPAPSRRG